MSYNEKNFYGDEQDAWGNISPGNDAEHANSGLNSDYSFSHDTTETFSGIEKNNDCVSFGASNSELQLAANLSQLAEWSGGTLFGKICEGLSNGLSGADVPGMEMLQEKVNAIADFYNIDPVKVFYEEGEPGVQFSGMTPLNYDNWIGGDPQVLSMFSEVYGDDFVTNVIAHETGHQLFDRLGLETEYPRISNEACADYMAGLYAGSRGLDPVGFAEFLKQHPGDGETYPEERYELFMEGYNKTLNYEWNMFQDIVDDPKFDLKETLKEVAERYC